MSARYLMIDYIREGPEALRHTLEANEASLARLRTSVHDRGLKNVLLTGIGSSYTALRMAGPCWLEHSKLPTLIIESADFAGLPRHVLNERALVLAVSRSGERGLVVDALARAREAGAVCAAITSKSDSLLARSADHVLTTAEGPEVTFPKTKSVLAATGLLMQTAQVLDDPDSPEAAKATAALHDAPAAMSETLASAEPSLLAALPGITASHLVAVVGTGANWGTALEAALKIQESAFIPTYGNSTDALLNGPIGALNSDWLVIALVSQRDLALTEQLLAIAHSLGADSLVVAEPGLHLASQPTWTVSLPRAMEASLSPLVFLPPLQLLTYHWTVSRGLNPDAPASMNSILQAILPPGRSEPELSKG